MAAFSRAAGGSCRQHGSAWQPGSTRRGPGPGAAQQARRGAAGLRHCRRRPRTALMRLLPARRRQARVSARGPAGAGPSPRHRQPPISASVRAAGSGASRVAPHLLALTPRARRPGTLRAHPGGQGHSRRLPLTRRRTGAEPSRDPQDAHPHFPGRARTSWPVHTGHTLVGKDTSRAQKRVRIWAEAPTAPHLQDTRTHRELDEATGHCTPPHQPPNTNTSLTALVEAVRRLRAPLSAAHLTGYTDTPPK